MRPWDEQPFSCPPDFLVSPFLLIPTPVPLEVSLLSLWSNKKKEGSRRERDRGTTEKEKDGEKGLGGERKKPKFKASLP